VLRAARRGDDHAWAELYDELAGSVLGYLRSHGAPDPEDVLGEVLLQVVRGLPRFEGDEPGFRAWVFTIAHRRLQDAHRRRFRRPVVDASPAAIEAAMPAVTIEAEAVTALSTADVVAVLGRLTDDQREVLALRVVSGLSIGEGARATGRTTEAVKALSKRGLARLRELVGLGGPDLTRGGSAPAAHNGAARPRITVAGDDRGADA
jgi:RNA polymerase sigma factor (sigma-70 family)